MVEISDQKSAETWLRSQPHSVQTCFAAKSALRALPLISAARADRISGIVLPTFRAVLASSVVAVRATAVSRGAAYFASERVDHAQHSASYEVDSSAYSGEYPGAKAALGAALSAFCAAETAARKTKPGRDPSIEASRSAAGAVSNAENAFAELETENKVYMKRHTLWSFASRDAFLFEAGARPEEVFRQHCLPGNDPSFDPEDFLAILSDALVRPSGTWEFWLRWYGGILRGAPLPWSLQEIVATQIEEETWEAGPDAVAKRIAEIERQSEQRPRVAAEQEQLVPPEAKQAMAETIGTNKNSITLTAAGLKEQLADYRERVRGDNQIDPDVRDDLLGVIDDLSERLSLLLEIVSKSSDTSADVIGATGVEWLRGFKNSLLMNARQYCAPENVANATIPTAIILSCTGLGSLLGMPVAGTVIGGLLTGQLKPAKAAEDLLKPVKPPLE